MAKKVLDVVDLLYNQKKQVEVDESELPTPEITAEELLDKMEGDTDDAGVNVDLSEDGKKIKITLDQDIKDAISGNNTVEITFTEDDWDEDEMLYVKRVELNNTFITINFINNPEHGSAGYRIYNPYFNAMPLNETRLIDGFSGFSSPPDQRYLSFMFRDSVLVTYVSIFNSLVSELFVDI